MKIPGNRKVLLSLVAITATFSMLGASCDKEESTSIDLKYSPSLKITNVKADGKNGGPSQYTAATDGSNGPRFPAGTEVTIIYTLVARVVANNGAPDLVMKGDINDLQLTQARIDEEYEAECPKEISFSGPLAKKNDQYPPSIEVTFKCERKVTVGEGMSYLRPTYRGTLGYGAEQRDLQGFSNSEVEYSYFGVARKGEGSNPTPKQSRSYTPKPRPTETLASKSPTPTYTYSPTPTYSYSPTPTDS